MKTILTYFFFFFIWIFACEANERVRWLKDIEKTKQVSLRNKNFIIIVLKDNSYWSEKLEELVKGFSLLDDNASLYTFCTLSTPAFSNVYSTKAPNIILMHPKYGIVSKIGYMPIDTNGLDIYIKNQINNFEKIKDVIENVKKYDSKKLEKAFLLSKEMDCDIFQKQLLEEGSDRTDTAFFAFEKYQMLLDQFSYGDEKVKFARDDVKHKDPKNIQKYHLKIAISDFLALVQQKGDTMDIIKPLTDYAQIYGQKDKKNIWKIYMTISQFFLGKKNYYESLNYARIALKKSPRSVREHIKSSIKYLRQKVNTLKKNNL